MVQMAAILPDAEGFGWKGFRADFTAMRNVTSEYTVRKNNLYYILRQSNWFIKIVGTFKIIQ